MGGRSAASWMFVGILWLASRGLPGSCFERTWVPFWGCLRLLLGILGDGFPELVGGLLGLPWGSLGGGRPGALSSSSSSSSLSSSSPPRRHLRERRTETGSGGGRVRSVASVCRSIGRDVPERRWSPKSFQSIPHARTGPPKEILGGSAELLQKHTAHLLILRLNPLL